MNIEDIFLCTVLMDLLGPDFWGIQFSLILGTRIRSVKQPKKIWIITNKYLDQAGEPGCDGSIAIMWSLNCYPILQWFWNHSAETDRVSNKI